MNLSPPPARHTAGDVIPMINVAFLLLIFFLVMARLAPPEPLDVAPPLAGGTATDGETVLFVDAEGAIALDTQRDEAALEELAIRSGPVLIRADADLDAVTFARLLARLAEIGRTDIRLATVPE